MEVELMLGDVLPLTPSEKEIFVKFLNAKVIEGAWSQELVDKILSEIGGHE